MLGVTRIMKIGIRVAEWATPHVKEWHRERNLNRNEAHRHLQASNWSEAEKHFLLALEEKQHSRIDRLELLLGLAGAQRCQSKLEDAERSACDAVKMAVREEDRTMHALALDTLADVQLDQQRYQEAEKTAQEIIRLETAHSKPDHARLAKYSRKLGTALDRNQRPAEAVEALKKALGHAEKAYGGEHPETATHLHELGMLHRRQGQHDAAQVSLRRALSIHRTIAKQSPEASNSREATEALYNLAASLEESGDLLGAAAEFERMLVLRERQVGANAEETAMAQVRLAGLHLQIGRVSSARELLLHALPALERKGGPPLTGALEAMAGVEDRSGRADQARNYHEKALIAAALYAAETREIG
jgi:tetratricopeptide (TPR) repeat protein